VDGLVSDHYRGDRGLKYVAGRQDKLDHLGHRLQARLYLPFLSATDRVLDFGCANGSLARVLQPHVAHVCGLEINEHSRRLATDSGLQVYAALAELPCEPGCDKIVSNHVLEHVPNVPATLRALRGNLRPNGRLIVIVPIEDHRTARNRTWRSDDYDRHLYTWTPLLFGNLLDEAGFKPLRLDILTTAWSPRLFFLGDTAVQRVANWGLAQLLRRRQLRAVAQVA
jgi:SAM-dependent methyltransferase